MTEIINKKEGNSANLLRKASLDTENKSLYITEGHFLKQNMLHCFGNLNSSACFQYFPTI